MVVLRLKLIFFVLAVLSFAEPQNNKLTIDSKCIEIFITTFIKTVTASPKLLQILNFYHSSNADTSKNVFMVIRDALQSVKAEHPDSLAKYAADAVYQVLPFSNEYACLYLKPHTVAVYLLSQNILTAENAKSLAIEFTDVLLMNYPNAREEVNSYTLARAFAYGFVDYLVSLGLDTLMHASACALSITKNVFAYSILSEPSVEVTVVAPVGTIPFATDVFGVTSFSSTFMSAVDSSIALQSIFWSSEQSSSIGGAWQGALDSYCKSINCSTPGVYTFKNIVSDTYNYLTKSAYVKSISNAFALTMMERGKLTYNNSIDAANNLAKTMESFVNGLALDSNCQTKLGVIFTAFNGLWGPENNILNLYQVFAINIATEFYAATPVKAPFVSFF